METADAVGVVGAATPSCVFCGVACPGAAPAPPQPTAAVLLACGHAACVACDAVAVTSQQMHRGRPFHDFEVKCPVGGCGGLYFANQLLQAISDAAGGDDAAAFALSAPDDPLHNFWAVQGGIPDPDGAVHPVTAAAVRWPSVEHAMETKKLAPDAPATAAIAELIAASASGFEAHKAGWGPGVVVRPDWDAQRLPTLRRLLRAKAAASSEVRQCLVATVGKPIVRADTDFYWGATAMMGPWQGRNNAGAMWTAVRDELLLHGTPAVAGP